MFRELCGESTLKNSILVTNMWSEVSKEIGEAREAELTENGMFFKPALEKGARMMRHDNTQVSAFRILEALVGSTPIALQIQEEIVDKNMDVSQTAAGMEVDAELRKQAEQHRQEMERLRRDAEGIIRPFMAYELITHAWLSTAEAIRIQEEKKRQEKEAEEARIKAEMDQARIKAQEEERARNEEKARIEREIQEAAQRAREIAEQAAAEFQRHAMELQEQMRRAQEEAERHRQWAMAEMNRMRERDRGGCIIM
ncbi:hypothetical protein AMATHDRAFT_6263 [Amanita thiersii Skay4041]|uniref:Uncharacterized protein n=1 Tax=Amanita thiersii Skay4041 TaxID=703135 RepID=A0A2A9ND12_9AGAR|nr:hypothetical protein AMATHDRAFT_6263 [Amanita thiersii Skay4041]